MNAAQSYSYKRGVRRVQVSTRLYWVLCVRFEARASVLFSLRRFYSLLRYRSGKYDLISYFDRDRISFERAPRPVDTPIQRLRNARFRIGLMVLWFCGFINSPFFILRLDKLLQPQRDVFLMRYSTIFDRNVYVHLSWLYIKCCVLCILRPELCL